MGMLSPRDRWPLINLASVVAAVLVAGTLSAWAWYAAQRSPIDPVAAAETVLLDESNVTSVLLSADELAPIVAVTGGEVTPRENLAAVEIVPTELDPACRPIFWPQSRPVAQRGTDQSSFHETGGFARAIDRADVFRSAEAAERRFDELLTAFADCPELTYRVTTSTATYTRTNSAEFDATRLLPTIQLESALSYTIEATDYLQVFRTTITRLGNTLVTFSTAYFDDTEPPAEDDSLREDQYQKLMVRAERVAKAWNNG
ncbi:sensor domain-containing protein [Ruicaihuangia caeni]|uniref:sensor domain-containing protein n=1 Tax=Ruicaihuangia caeni TaxID=3042517 RepID=UPI00338DCD3A